MTGYPLQMKVVHRLGRRPHPAALPPPSGAAARPSLKTVHWTVFRALRAPNPGKAIRAAACPSLKTVHWTVFRALRTPNRGEAMGCCPPISCADRIRDIDLLLQDSFNRQGRPRKPSPGWGLLWGVGGSRRGVHCHGVPAIGGRGVP